MSFYIISKFAVFSIGYPLLCIYYMIHIQLHSLYIQIHRATNDDIKGRVDCYCHNGFIKK